MAPKRAEEIKDTGAKKREKVYRKSYPKLPLHNSQAAVCKRASVTIPFAIKDKKSIVLADAQGYGKTRMTAAIMTDYEELYQNKANIHSLQIFCTQTLKVIQELHPELGLERSTQLQLSVIRKNKELEKTLMKDKNMRECMTHRMLKDILFGNKTLADKEHGLQEHIHDLCDLLPSDTVVNIFIDEAHLFIGRLPVDKFETMWTHLNRIARKKNIRFAIHPISATLSEDKNDALRALCNREFIRAKMTEDEKKEYAKDLFVQPRPPDAYTIINLPSPCRSSKYAESLKALRNLILHNCILKYKSPFTKNETTQLLPAIRTKMKDIMYELVARIAGESDLLLDQVRMTKMMRYYAATKTRSPADNYYPGVVISASDPIGGHELNKYLTTVAADENGAQFHYVDLRDQKSKLGDANSRTAQVAKHKEMLESVKSQNKGATLALISPRQRESTNSFAKNIQIVISVDGSMDGRTRNGMGMSHLKGRLGRAVPLEEGDLIPEKYVAIHLRCPWADEMRKCIGTKQGTEIEEVLKRIDRLMENNTENTLFKMYNETIMDKTALRNLERAVFNDKKCRDLAAERGEDDEEDEDDDDYMDEGTSLDGLI